MDISFEVTITSKDMRGYMFAHKYRSISGVFEIILGIACLAFGLIRYGSIKEEWQSYMLILIFFGVFFLLITPINTYVKASKQVLLNPSFKEPFQYVLNEEGIHISQNGESADLTWDAVYKAVKCSTGIFLYGSKYRANILPARCIEGKEEDIVKLLKKCISKERLGYGLRK